MGTPLWKLFPVLWVSPFVIGMIRLVWEWLTLPDGAASPFANFNPLVLLLPVFGGAFAFWMLGGLKSVYLTDDSLLVSNFLKVIEVPLANIENVSEPENSSHRRIAVYLRSPSAFGSKIVFMPPLRMAREIADNLRNRVGVPDKRPEGSALGNVQRLHIKLYRDLLKHKKVK